MIFQNISDINESLMYIDKATIYRNIKKTLEDGSTAHELCVHKENITCKLDIKKNDEPASDGDVNSLNMIYTLFTSNLHDFRKGDVLKIFHYGKEYNMLAGEPIISNFHQQIPLSREEYA